MDRLIGYLLVACIFGLVILVHFSNLWVFWDVLTFMFITFFVYGMSMVIFGLSTTLKTVMGIKYLVVPPSAAENSLARVYKTQMQLSLLAGLMLGLIWTLTLLNNPPEAEALFPALTVCALAITYPVIMIGLVYFPLYRKLAVHP